MKSYDANWDYAHRLSSCSQFITNLGCGYHDYQIMKQTRQPGSPKKLAAARDLLRLFKQLKETAR